MFTPSTPDLSALNGIYEDKQKMVRAAELAMLNSAEAISQRLFEAIREYQRSLPDKDDVALQVVTFGSNTTILVERIGYIGSNLVVFGGKDNSGKPLELIQHINQLSFLMMVAQKPSVEAPKRQIGFAGEWN